MNNQPSVEEVQYFLDTDFFSQEIINDVSDVMFHLFVLGLVLGIKLVINVLHESFFASEVLVRVLLEIDEHRPNLLPVSITLTEVRQFSYQFDQMLMILVDFRDTQFQRSIPMRERHKVVLA